jgi:hypothetical protein
LILPSSSVLTFSKYGSRLALNLFSNIFNSSTVTWFLDRVIILSSLFWLVAKSSSSL